MAEATPRVQLELSVEEAQALLDERSALQRPAHAALYAALALALATEAGTITTEVPTAE